MTGVYGYVTPPSKIGDSGRPKTVIGAEGYFGVSTELNTERVYCSTYKLAESRREVAFCESDRHWAWVDGKAHNYMQFSNAETGDHTSFGQALLDEVEQGSLKRFLQRVDGSFCCVLIAKNTGDVMLISDRFGLRNLFWTHSNGVFSWGTHVTPIAAAWCSPTDISSESLQCFLELGYLPGEITFFDPISLIEPATIITFGAANQVVKKERYWAWNQIQPISMCFDVAAHKVAAILQTAVSKRFDSSKKTGVSLSGGLDSRALLAAIANHRENYAGTAFTFGAEGSLDERIAEEVMAKLPDWTHLRLHITAANWLGPRLSNVLLTDGMLDLQHMHGIEFAKEVSSKLDINFNGYCGDIILGGGWVTRSNQDKRIDRETAEKFYGHYAKLTHYDSNIYDVDCTEPNLYMNRVRRFTGAGTASWLNYLEQAEPFFDKDLVELIVGLPDRYRFQNKLYSEVLLQQYPLFFKDIPWQKTGRPVGHIGIATVAYMGLISLLRKTRRKAGLADKSNFVDYRVLMNTEAAERLFTRDLGRNLLGDFLGPKTERQIINSSKGKSDYTASMLRAATLQIYIAEYDSLRL